MLSRNGYRAGMLLCTALAMLACRSVATRAAVNAGEVRRPEPERRIRYVPGKKPFMDIVVPWLEEGRALMVRTPHGKVYVRLVDDHVRSPIDNGSPTMHSLTFIVNSPRGIPVRFEGQFSPTGLEINGKPAYDERDGRTIFRVEWKSYRSQEGHTVEYGTIWLPGGRNTVSFVR